MDTNSQIVGVDHGNMQIKTAHTCFTTIATDPNGIITCMRRIQEVCVAQTNEKIDEYMIREFITKGDVRLDQEFIDIMVKELTGYTKDTWETIPGNCDIPY